MASEVDICNLALAHLGDDATVASISPPEGSAQAEHCAQFYPIARDSLLEMHGWKFATRRKALAKLDIESWNWEFAYAVPAGMLKALAVLSTSASSDTETQPYELESGDNGEIIILTNLDAASLRYTAVVSDTTRFPPLFIDALGWLLAAHLAGPVVKGDTGAALGKACHQTFQLVLSSAKTSDANQRKVAKDHNPAWLAAR